MGRLTAVGAAGIALLVSTGTWAQEGLSAKLDPSGMIRVLKGNTELAMIELNAHGPAWKHAPQTDATAEVSDLADKTGKLLPRAGASRYGTLQWVHWQMANLGPMMGNANHFKNYAKQLVEDPAQLAYGTRRFVGEVDRLCGVMDAQLSVHRHLAGPEYTIADIVTWPWACLLGRLIDEGIWASFPALKRWVDEVGARPAVRRGRDLHKEWGERELSEDEQKRRREILFNQTNEKVRVARQEAARGAATPQRAR